MPEKIQKPGNTEETSNKTLSTEKSSSPIPSISLPKGGGAIRGIGEKFAANPVTGTGSLSVPIFTSPGRSGFGPQLSLSYDSGSGNGPFGFGWSLSLPSITRKTDKGLPKYQDAFESDVFVLSGAEDLVPVFKKKPDGNWDYESNGKPKIDEEERDGYMVRRYRPRIEGLFARIERWTGQTGDIHWRSITKDNVITIYGKTDNSRIADPKDNFRVFSWLISESYDDRGNAIFYEYKKEDSSKVELSEVHEKNRSDLTRSANRYLKHIRYGNQTPREINEDLSKRTNWLFEVVFDYGEHDDSVPTLLEPQKWQQRKDAFSTYRSGFEVRTYRLCQRVLMFHHFPDKLGINDYLVRSTEFNYNESPIASFITKITQSGFVRKSDGKYLNKSLPPLEFGYSQATIQDKISQIDAKSLENLPQGLDGMSYRWVDLDGEGLSGILTEQADGWFYKPNRGGGDFGPLQLLSEKPSLAALNSGRQQFMDLAGDGQIELVEFSGPLSGFYERTQDRRWEQFTNFASLPNINWNDANLKFLDLTGDGHADILITEDNVFTWYPSLAEQGFGMSERVSIPFDEEKGPKLIFADGTQSIYLGDMSGGGLTDLVRIRNGEVCYWPNLGYGRFGAKVTMDNSPWFDAPDIFDHKRIQLADIDGSGTIDIIYLGQEGVNIYFNQSGNSWGKVQTLTLFPHIDNLTSVTVVDLFGNGTACLVWSSPLPGDSSRPMLYIDLMGGLKPHLMINSKNNMGAETVVKYAASTKFYLEDKARGKPWITRIPFPVHVVESVETHDHISQNRFVTSYAYHHGYFDGIEREFRGFGMVEQKDTEEFAVLSDSDEFPSATNIDEASHVPPVVTKTWFHTGVFLRGEEISRQLASEYFGAPDPDTAEFETFLKTLLDDTVLPSVEITADETCEACRSLKGSILRQEVYAKDGSLKAGIPYGVSERNYTIKKLQPRGSNQHAVFFTHANETINYRYERNINDPRIQHEMVMKVDDFGNVERSVAIGYPRGAVADRQPEQNETHITLTVNRFINSPELTIKFPDRYPPKDTNWYRVGVPSETQTYEIVIKPPEPNVSTTTVSLFKFKDIRTLTEDLFPLHLNEPDTSKTLLYEKWNWRKDVTIPSGKKLRLIERMRTLYRMNDLTGLLMPDQVDSLALPGESYKLAFTPELLTNVFVTRTDDDMFTKGGYVHSQSDSNWWIPSGRVFYHSDPAASPSVELTEAIKHFFLPRRLRDPFDQNTFVRFDSYDLLTLNSEDPLKNKVTAGERTTSGAITPMFDYRVLQPYLVTDPNGNRSQVIFDALGMVAGAAVMGKAIEPDDKPKGDLLDGFQPNLTQAQLDAFMAEPRVTGADPSEGAAAQIMHDLLAKATSRIIYDIDRFKRTGEPPFAATIVRETHNADLKEGKTSKLQVSFSYSDGFGREIQKKIQAEPLVEGGPKVNPRWVGSGWTIFNNKGKPVRQYEPFFDDTHKFKFGKKVGKSSILFYDPVERVVATLHPNHTYEKVVFDPWHQKTYDVNDTVKMDPRTDVDIKGYVEEYFKQEAPPPHNWETWLKQRGVVDPDAPPQELIGMAPDLKAALRTLPHADTPTVAYFDTLGRPFLTVAHNKFERRTNGSVTIIDEKYRTRVVLDIEGNQREVRDERKNKLNILEQRIVMKYDYDMLGTRIHQSSMEAGERWMLNDVTGKPIRAWDSRGFIRSMTYDALRRPVELSVTDASGMEFLAEKTEYGESAPDPKTTNHRTKPWKLYDGAGVVVSDRYDFKGNLLLGKRQLLPQHYCKDQVNWAVNLQPNETFTSSTTYDALNRPIQIISPHRTGGKLNVIQPVYNEANLLEREDVWLGQTAEPPGLLDAETATQDPVKKNDPLTYTGPVKNIDYNAKGQRVFIEYGNGVVTNYIYDPFTFRLEHMETLRDTDSLQDIFYTYDPAGNITAIRDAAQTIIHYDGEKVYPVSEYRYDAIYRLIEASGREHIGLASKQYTTWNDEGRTNLTHPNDGHKMRNYFEFYKYDEVGNILYFDHDAKNGNWDRAYEYEENSLTELDRKNNRLSRTIVHPNGHKPINEPYTYDPHGNMKSMLHLKNMEWDFRDQLQHVDKGNEQVYYVYDAGGQRVRKVAEKNKGKLIEERIYLGGFEIFHRHDVSELILERETLHIMDDKQRIMLIETRTLPTKPNLKDPIQLIRYQLGNHLGSAVLELDENAHRISCEEYYPYGSTSYQAVRKDIEVPLKRYRYTGMERDEETGLNYHGARYYAPWLGRWTSCDPVGTNARATLYTYCSNSPINRVDPMGTQDKPGFVGEQWESAIGATRSAQSWVKEFAQGLAFQEVVKPAVEMIKMGRAAGVHDQTLEKSILYPAVVIGGVIATVAEMVGGVVMTGPNITEALDTAGHELGEGAEKVWEGKTGEEKALGIAKLGAGMAGAALAVVQILTMTRGADLKGGLRSDSSMSKGQRLQENWQYGKKFEKHVTRQEGGDLLSKAADQVTIRPNVAPGVAGTQADNFVIDTLTQNRFSDRFSLLEAKSTATARLSKNQIPGFQLMEQFGGEVRGRPGAAFAPGGIIIPPTAVQVLRQNELLAGLELRLSLGIFGSETIREAR